MSASFSILAWLFINPLPFPAGARLWMLLPLVACIALVYRATRARNVRELPWSTVRTFLSIVIGMVLIAAGFYALHMFVRHSL